MPPHYVGQRQGAAHRVDFSRDIRPILNQNCTSCHGVVRQKNGVSGVSFIYREEALGKGKPGCPTIAPGDPEAPNSSPESPSINCEARMPYRASRQQTGNAIHFGEVPCQHVENS